MIQMRLSEAAAALGIPHAGTDTEFRGCSIDSRLVSPGELFVALRGPRYDGHEFVAEALRRGAAGAMVEQRTQVDLPTLHVKDTRRSLGELAGVWRGRFALPVIAVTGSNGKTTVKDMLASILDATGPVLATRGNLNNEIGAPLTLLGIGSEHRCAVVELGANHPGEIAWLASLARPVIGLITQCAPAHLAGFGTVEGVARAKGELFEYLDAGGTAVINADDVYAPLWRCLAGQSRQLTFGLESHADITGSWNPAGDGIALTLRTPAGEAQLQLRLPGRHNAMNALAATATALAAGLSLNDIVSGLGAVTPVRGRLEIKQGWRNTRVLDDTYNANPDSLRAALEVLANYPGERWLVLGDMVELADEGPAYHEQAAAWASESGVERAYTTGKLSERTARAFGSGGRHFSHQAELIAQLRTDLTAGVTVLVKGSRTMQMERVVEALEEMAAERPSDSDPASRGSRAAATTPAGSARRRDAAPTEVSAAAMYVRGLSDNQREI